MLAPFCAAAALWETFRRCTVRIFVGAPIAERVRHNRFVAIAFAGITTAVLGVIGSLVLTLNQPIVFASFDARGSAGVVSPFIASHDNFTLVLATATTVASMRFKVNVFVVIASCAHAGTVTTL